MAPIDFNGLDTAVHGPVRLGVLTALHTDGPLDFTTLKKRLDVADGALGVHLKKLQTKRYVSLKLSYVGRRPKTTYRVTVTGRRALMDYLDVMQQLIDTVQATPDKRRS